MANIKVEGMAKVNKALNKLIGKSEEAAKTAVAKTALHAIGIAKKTVKVKTARLRTSLTGTMAGQAGLKGEVSFDGKQVTNLRTPSDKFVAIVGTDVDYAAAQEFGKNGRPYLRPAGQSAIKFLIDAVKAQFKRIKV